MSLTTSSDVSGRPRSWLRPLDGALRRGVLARLASIEDGGLVVVEDEFSRTFGAGTDDPHVGRIEVRDSRTWRLCTLAGALGFAEAYVRGYWTSPDLVAVLRVFARNIARSSGPGWLDAGPARWLARRWHAQRPNSRAGARRNVRDHYDLGNDFFRLFLDETMTYSCAFFARPEISLRDAQLAKLDLVIDALAIGPEDHVLEIGTGWGSFAIRAAARSGCRVTTTTISREQHHEATARVRAAGLADRVEVLDQDYRTLRGTYDKIASIEMIEAIGRAQGPTFFAKCADLLRPGGTLLVQAITMAERDWDHYVRNPDFIQLRVFPGSSLVSLPWMRESIAGTDLQLESTSSLGPHYAETLRRWRSAFRTRRAEARELGYGESFLRLWDYYLAYCEAGFREDYVDDVQVRFRRPGAAT